MNLCCFLFNIQSVMYWFIEMRNFTLTKQLHYTIEGFWISACGCGDNTGSTTNSVCELWNMCSSQNRGK